MTWTSTSTSQAQTAVGANLGDVVMKQEADTGVVVKAGSDIRSESNVWATQTQAGWNATQAGQQQATNSGAAIMYPWGFFPAQVTAQSMGNTAQAQGITALMPMQDQNSMINQKARVDSSGYEVNSNLMQHNAGTGSGTFNQQQANAGSGAVQAWAVPPFPTANTFSFFTGNNVGRLFQTINLSNMFQFGPF